MVLDGIIASILNVFSIVWWIVVPFALAFILWDVRLYYVQNKFRQGIEWVMLEIKIPREVEKTPKAMEQIFATLMSSYSYGKTWKKKYWEGESEEWFSWEIFGSSQGIRFFIRAPKGHRHLVESSIYSQYPSAEIFEAEDYATETGMTLPNKAFDIWGTEFVLAREDAYPIRTYTAFEEDTEEALIDPMAPILEVMSRLKEGERIVIQMLMRPTGKATGNDWVGEGEKIRDGIVGRKKAPKKSRPLDEVFLFARHLAEAPFRAPEFPEKKEEKRDEYKLLAMTPGERDIVEGIEKKIAKLGYETIVRFVFIDDRDHFSRAYISAVIGAFQQFNTHNMNSFRPNSTITAISKGFFKKRRVYLRKRRLYDSFVRRRMGRKAPVLNIEELATIFHFPSIAVKSPGLQPVTTRKGEPPASLPVE